MSRSRPAPFFHPNAAFNECTRSDAHDTLLGCAHTPRAATVVEGGAAVPADYLWLCASLRPSISHVRASTC